MPMRAIHTPLHLTRTNGSAVTACSLAGRPGPALGLFDGAKYETQHCKLSQRDVVLLFTDGLFEVEGSDGQLYDYEQLSKAVDDRAQVPPRRNCAVASSPRYEHFSATRQFNDDVCLVAIDIDRLKPL